MYSLSIIIPLYNEEKRLTKSLKKLEKFILQNKKNKIEIIFVSDGSTDLTTQIIKQFIKKNKKNLKSYLIEYKKNVGKGYAVKKGILKSKKDWVLICDADMSVKPDQFDIWFKKKNINNKNVAYYGSRNHKNSKIKTLFIRRLLGSFFKILIRILFKLDLKDTQCGFKLYNKKYIKKIFNSLTENGFAHDIELIFLLKREGVKIKELPVEWKHNDGSKLNIYLEPIKFFNLW